MKNLRAFLALFLAAISSCFSIHDAKAGTYFGFAFGNSSAKADGVSFNEDGGFYIKSIYLGSGLLTGDSSAADAGGEKRWYDSISVRGETGYVYLPFSQAGEDMNVSGFDFNMYADYSIREYLSPYAGFGLGFMHENGSRYTFVPQFSIGLDVAFSSFTVGFEYRHMNALFKFYDDNNNVDSSHRVNVDSILFKIRF
jgi:hypothetical protein